MLWLCMKICSFGRRVSQNHVSSYWNLIYFGEALFGLTFENNITVGTVTVKFCSSVVQGIEKIKRHKLQEVRRRMQTEDEETFNAIGTSPTSSQTSSLDGVFPAPDTRSIQSHPFRIIEHDALSLHSLTSLGRSSRILSNSHESQPGKLFFQIKF